MALPNILKSLPTYNDFLIPTPPLPIIQPELVSNDSSSPSISKSSRIIKSLYSPEVTTLLFELPLSSKILPFRTIFPSIYK